MTKSEARKARKAGTLRDYHQHTAGVCNLLVCPRDDRGDRETFSETPRGYRAREHWARRYDSLNGAPESDSDR